MKRLDNPVTAGTSGSIRTIGTSGSIRTIDFPSLRPTDDQQSNETDRQLLRDRIIALSSKNWTWS